MNPNNPHNRDFRQGIRQRQKKWLFKVLFLVPFLTGITHISPAEMYKWIDEHGQTHYTDTKPNDQTTLEIKGTISSYSAPQISTLADDFFSQTDKKTGRKKVIMYSAQWCGVCKRAKKFFTQNKIPHTEYDIDQSKKAKQAFDRLNGRGVPIILVGRKRMNGFSEENFMQLYEGS